MSSEALVSAELVGLFRRQWEMCNLQAGEVLVLLSDAYTDRGACRQRLPPPKQSARMPSKSGCPGPWIGRWSIMQRRAVHRD